jgi:hypothetical protein
MIDKDNMKAWPLAADDPAIGTPAGMSNYAKGYATGRKKGEAERLQLLAENDKLTQERDDLRAEVERLKASARPKDHNIRQLVNDLRNIAETFGGTQQLRSRISGAVGQFVDDSFGAHTKAGKPAEQEQQ